MLAFVTQICTIMWQDASSSTPQTSAIFVGQVREPPDVSQTNSVAETGEDELCGAAPLSTLVVVIVFYRRDVLK